MNKHHLSKIVIVLTVLMQIMPVFAATQTGGGYVVTGQVNPISSLTTGGGYTSQAGGNPVVVKTTGGSYSVYGNAFYLTTPSTGPTTLVSSGGGGGGGGGCHILDPYCNTPKLAAEDKIVARYSVAACTAVIKVGDPIRYGYQYRKTNNPVDVKIVEQFLNEFEGEKLKVDGIYSRADYRAVIRWQEKYADDVLKPWGITKGTGYVFTTSIAQMKRQQTAKCALPVPVEDGIIPSKEACAANIKIADPIKYSPTYKNDPNDVKIVQAFLNNFEGEKLKVDGKYNKASYDAVVRWQEKYRAAVLTPWGIKKGTGYVFVTSIAQMKRQQVDRCDPTKKFHVPIPDVTQYKTGGLPSSLGRTAIGTNSELECPYFTEYQSYGARNLEVVKIQEFLNKYMDAKIEATGFYGSDTVAAVKDFQNKYSGDILHSWGIDFPATGWWFKTTRKKANELLGCPEPEIIQDDTSTSNGNEGGF